jgi:hypothetical protein
MPGEDCKWEEVNGILLVRPCQYVFTESEQKYQPEQGGSSPPVQPIQNNDPDHNGTPIQNRQKIAPNAPRKSAPTNSIKNIKARAILF